MESFVIVDEASSSSTADEPPTKTIKPSSDFCEDDDEDALLSIGVFICLKCRQTLSVEDLLQLTRCGHKICRQCTRRFLLDWAILQCPLYNEPDNNKKCAEEMTLEDASLVLDDNELTLFRSQSQQQILEEEEHLLAIASNNFGVVEPVVVVDGQFLCDICTVASSLEEIFQVGLDCNHILCRFCASNYVNDPEKSATITTGLLNCPILGCRAKMDPKSVDSVADKALLKFDCQICAETTGQSDLFRFERSCGHEICRDCARRYLHTLIDDRKPLRCPLPDCQAEFDFADAELVLDETDYERLFDMLLQISVADCVHCPKPNCCGVAEVVPPRSLFVCPVCDYNMCVKCRLDWHGAAVSCEQYARWLKASGNNDTDANFAEYARSKQIQICPRCHQGVEKTQGCNHMQCRCGAHFCYKCGQIFEGIIQHYCKNNWLWQ